MDRVKVLQARRVRERDKAKKQEAALQEIHALLDGNTWSPSTLDDIAEVMRAAGFPVRDPNEMRKQARRKVGA